MWCEQYIHSEHGVVATSILSSYKTREKRKRVSDVGRDVGTGRCRHSLLRHCRCPEAMEPSSDIMSALSGVARDITRSMPHTSTLSSVSSTTHLRGVAFIS